MKHIEDENLIPSTDINNDIDFDDDLVDEADEDEDEAKPPRSAAVKIIIACIVLMLLIGTVLFGILGVNYLLNKMPRTSTETSTIAPEDEDFETDASTPDTINVEDLVLEAVEPLDDEKLLNILLVGQDKHEDDVGRMRSDAMILVSVNMETYQVSLISFLRDLYVLLPGYTSNRMNAAYVFGGYELLEQTMLTNFGIHLDGYFEVDFSRFKSVIDIAGGVDIYLTDAEAEIIGDGVTQGINHLDGKQALSYARIRKLDSDFGRTERQRTVLNALFQQVKDLGLTDILKLIDSILPMLTTNLSNTEIVSYATKLVPHATTIKISTHSVPSDGTYVNETIRGMMVLVPDLNRVRTVLKDEYLPFNYEQKE